MNERDKSVEIKVGIFVLIGLVVLGGTIIYFGLQGEGYKSYYHMTVKLPDVNGLIKGSNVMLAGAKVGFVDQKPRIQSNIGFVSVPLKIYSEIKLPKEKSHFQVGSSGLLGDKFVEVVLDPDFNPARFNPDDPAQFWEPGATVEGTRAQGLEELQATGNEVMKKLSAALDQLKVILSDTNVRNLQETFANLETTSSNFVDASNKITGVVQDAQGAVDTARQTLTTANAAAGDLRSTIVDARGTLDTAKGAIRKATEGNGLIAALLTDHELAENIRLLITNLRLHGVLFYKDSAAKAHQPAAPEPAAR